MKDGSSDGNKFKWYQIDGLSSVSWLSLRLSILLQIENSILVSERYDLLFSRPFSLSTSPPSFGCVGKCLAYFCFLSGVYTAHLKTY